jgi:hypothetical protein
MAARSKSSWWIYALAGLVVALAVIVAYVLATRAQAPDTPQGVAVELVPPTPKLPEVPNLPGPPSPTPQ